MSKLMHLLDRPIAYQPSFVPLGAGVTGAVLLSQLVYWQNRMDGWFYKTQAEITAETGLTRYEQEGARKKLIAAGVLDEQLKGVPAKLYFRINEEALESQLLKVAENPHPSMRKTSKQGCEKTTSKNAEKSPTSLQQTNEPVSGISASIHTVDYTETTTENKTFCQPPAETDPEVVITDSAKQVLAHLNSITGSRYQVSKSSLDNIRGRLAEGFTTDELILTSDYLNAKWSGDLKMVEYLRPATMFQPSKFPGYLSGANHWHEAGRPKSVNGKWVRESGETIGADVADHTERDAAYRRFIGSGNPLKNPSQLEQTVRAEASKAGVRSMQVSFAVSRWNSIWKECAERIAGGKAA